MCSDRTSRAGARALREHDQTLQWKTLSQRPTQCAWRSRSRRATPRARSSPDRSHPQPEFRSTKVASAQCYRGIPESDRRDAAGNRQASERPQTTESLSRSWRRRRQAASCRASDATTMLMQPAAGILIVRTRVGNEPPELPRVIEPAQMHELMDEHVVPHPIGHQHQTPVKTDVPVRRARSPTPALVADADSRHPQVVPARELQQPRRQLPPRAVQGAATVGVGHARRLAAVGFEPPALLLNPGVEAAEKRARLPHGSPARQRDADAAVVAHRNHVTAGAWMSDEYRRRIIRLEGKAWLFFISARHSLDHQQ